MVTIRIAKEKITKLILALHKEGYSPSRAILFGSVAKHKAESYSDIDVALWDDKFTGSTPFDYEAIVHILRNFSGIELHTFHSSETANTNPFIEEIEKTGVEIVIDF